MEKNGAVAEASNCSHRNDTWASIDKMPRFAKTVALVACSAVDGQASSPRRLT